MYQQITQLIEQLKFHEHQHKVTIFNKEKNNQNMHSHNQTEGKLIQLLKQFHYFNQLNQNLGVDFLLKAVKYIEPYFLRKDRVLVNAKENASSDEFLLVEGIIKVSEIFIDEQTKKKSFIFQKYLSNGSHISFSEYKENQFQLLSHTDCQMLKLPSKLDLDPVKYGKKNIEIMQQLGTRGHDIHKHKLAIYECIEEIQKIKRIQMSKTFGLTHFDFNLLLIDSNIQKVSIHEKIYQPQDYVSKIGLILKGRVVQINKKIIIKKPSVTYDNAILTFYKKNFNVDPNKIEKNQNLLEVADWIGLQEYLKHLQSNPFRVQNIVKPENNDDLADEYYPKDLRFLAKKQVRTKEDCQILWIPIVNFAQKFNYQTNFSMVDQWKGLISIKEEAKQKNDKIHEELQKQKKERQMQVPLSELPRIPGKLEEVSHNVNTLTSKKQMKSRLIYQKQKKFGKLFLKNVEISQTSLLGITMKKDEEFQSLYEAPDITHYKKFSHFARSTKGKLFDISSPKSKDATQMGRSKKSFSEHKIQPQVFYGIETSPEDLIMYPQAYQASKLTPDLKKQLFLAEKAWRLSSIESNLPILRKPLILQSSRQNLLSPKLAEQNPQKNLASIASKSSISNTIITPSSSPHMLYKNIIEKISYKYPRLQQNLRIQKFYKKKFSQKEEKLTLKERISVLKNLEEAERKRTKRERHNSLVVEREDKLKKSRQIQLNFEAQKQSKF